LSLLLRDATDIALSPLRELDAAALATNITVFMERGTKVTESREQVRIMLNAITTRIGAISFILCAVWLANSVAFFAMVTSAGMEEMELEIGPLLSLEGSAATLFARGAIGFGLIMIGLFIWRRQVGFILALIWSVWWGIILASAAFAPLGLSERAIILAVVICFAGSAWLALTRLKNSIKPTTDNY
jgi:hypothetical protein